MDFIPYKINECFESKFYQIPIELFINPLYKTLNSDSKLLYGFLLNRFTLSAKNNWYDKNGNIYLIFTRKEVQKLLNLSDKTVTKAFKLLNNCKLIYEKKQGKNKPNLIYVGKINHDKNFKNWNRKISDSKIVNSTTQNTENLRPNYTNNNYNKRGNSKLAFEQLLHSDFDWESLYEN